MERERSLLEIAYNDPYLQLLMLDLKEHRFETYIHSMSVASICSLMGVQLKLYNRDIITLIKGALLHDIGKQLISEDILLKPSSLTEEEYEVVKEHSMFSSCMVHGYFSEEIQEIVQDHHEKLNGNGYPFKKKEISYLTQIVTVCDIYDALTKRGIYRDKYDNNKAFRILYSDARRGELNESLVDTLAFVVRKNKELWLWKDSVKAIEQEMERYGNLEYAY